MNIDDPKDEVSFTYRTEEEMKELASKVHKEAMKKLEEQGIVFDQPVDKNMVKNTDKSQVKES